MTHLLFITIKAANLKATLLKLKKNGPDLPFQTLFGRANLEGLLQ